MQFIRKKIFLMNVLFQEIRMIDTLDGWESVDGLVLALCAEARDFALAGNLEDAEKQLRRAIAFEF